MGFRICKNVQLLPITRPLIDLRIQAVSSCASDATYHVMWIILYNALDDFGIRELNGSPSPPPNISQIDAVKRKVVDEALHGSLRIAGLVSFFFLLACKVPGE